VKGKSRPHPGDSKFGQPLPKFLGNLARSFPHIVAWSEHDAGTNISIAGRNVDAAFPRNVDSPIDPRHLRKFEGTVDDRRGWRVVFLSHDWIGTAHDQTRHGCPVRPPNQVNYVRHVWREHLTGQPP